MSIPKVATRGLLDPQQLQRVAEAVNSLIDGKAAVTGTFTLTAGATATTITDNKFESNMVPVWSPTTSTAAAAMTSVRVTARTQGGFTLTHNNTADTDRTFLYVRLG